VLPHTVQNPWAQWWLCELRVLVGRVGVKVVIAMSPRMMPAELPTAPIVLRAAAGVGRADRSRHLDNHPYVGVPPTWHLRVTTP
jgi:hypothetical protein